MASTFLQSYKIVITRFFFPLLYFKLLRKIYGTCVQIFGMCASINNKNHNYKPEKSFSTQNHLWYGKKHSEKGHNTGKTQGKHREFYLSWNVATLLLPASEWWQEVMFSQECVCSTFGGRDVPTLNGWRGYLPWMREYLPWTGERVPTLDRGRHTYLG